MTEPTAGPERPEFTLTLAGDRQQLHCTGHDPQLFLGEWPADDDWNPDTAAGTTAAVTSHRREHPDVWSDDQDDEPDTAGGWYCNNANCDCRDEKDDDA